MRAGQLRQARRSVLLQFAMLQNAIFDTADLAQAISAWRNKSDGDFDALPQ
jgi:hypothetical protein